VPVIKERQNDSQIYINRDWAVVTKKSMCKYTTKRANDKGNVIDLREREQMILGMILWEPERFVEAKATLKPEDFRFEKHQVIYRAMLHLEDKGMELSVINLFDYLKDQGELETVGGSPYLTYLPQVVLVERTAWDSFETDCILKSLQMGNNKI